MGATDRMAKLSLAELKECAKGLTKAIAESQWKDVEAILKKLRDDAEPTEEAIRTTRLGKTIGPLRKSSDPAVAELAKVIVKKWKDLVDAEKKTKGEAGPSIKKSVEGSASPTSKGSGTPNATAGTPAPASPVITQAKPATNGSIGTGSTLKAAHPASSATPEAKSSTPIDFECLHDKTRNACLKLLHQSLETDYKGPDKGLVFETALVVEKACYEVIGKSDTSTEYRNKVRSLSLNLKDKANPSLRGSVLDGRILPERLVVMKPEEMASDARKAERQRLQMENLFNAKAAEDQQAETDAFECARCKQRKCTYYQKQTRSADEPMTVFVTCTNCKYRWKFS